MHKLKEHEYFMNVKTCVSQSVALSVDGELHVLLVLQQWRHPPHGFVPVAQHALFDARRLNLTDEALQRLQAAAEDCSMAQAETGHPTREVLLCAEALGMMMIVVVLIRMMVMNRWMELGLVWLMAVWVEVRMGDPNMSGPGCTRICSQHLRGKAVAVRVVPERSEELFDRALFLHSGSNISNALPVRQL